MSGNYNGQNVSLSFCRNDVTIQVWWQMAESNSRCCILMNRKTTLTWRTDRRVRSLQPCEALICETICQTPPGNDRRSHAKMRVSARVTLISRTDAKSATFQTNQDKETCKMQNTWTHVVKITQRWNLSLSSGGVTVQHLTCDVHVRVQPRAWLHKKLP